jgi:hypothetical protein
MQGDVPGSRKIEAVIGKGGQKDHYYLRDADHSEMVGADAPDHDGHDQYGQNKIGSLDDAQCGEVGE